jgi:hypothetical protein
MEFTDLIDQPERRRLWLLRKALESKPLNEAVMLAKKVEDFLTAPTPVRPRPAESTRVH